MFKFEMERVPLETICTAAVCYCRAVNKIEIELFGRDLPVKSMTFLISSVIIQGMINYHQ